MHQRFRCHPGSIQHDGLADKEEVVDQFVDPVNLLFQIVQKDCNVFSASDVFFENAFPYVTDGKGKEVEGISNFVGYA